ncbi:MAG TPA: helix-turn-helix transcriptional regulator [Nonomuraea sp.]|nr:helix-turn-helix transcriptional regulator [Nonomuraea sp.]
MTDFTERTPREEELALLGDASGMPVEPPTWQEQMARVSLLSPREAEVFERLGNGSSNRSIAALLNITERTVKAHVAQIMAKLGLESRLQAGLVSYAYLNRFGPRGGREAGMGTRPEGRFAGDAGTRGAPRRAS